MKLIQLTAIFSFVLLLASCSNKGVTYNNDLVKIQKELEPKVMAFSSHLSNSTDSAADIAAIVSEANELQKLTETKIADVNKLSVPSGGDNLKNAFLAEFNFIVDMCKNVKIFQDEKSAVAQKEAAQKWILDAETLGGKLDGELKTAQAAFAKDKGFKLETK